MLSLTLTTALRAAFIALGAILVAGWMVRRLGRFSCGSLALLLFLVLIPPLASAYSESEPKGSVYGGADGFYCFLMVLRAIPLAAVLLHALPPSAESSHAFAVMNAVSRRAGLAFHLRGVLGRYAAVFALLFLVLFQEFECAACLNASSWTIAFFDQHAGGLALEESLRLAVWPFLVSVVVVAGVVWFGRAPHFSASAKVSGRKFSDTLVGGSIVFVAIYQGLSAHQKTIGGYSALFDNPAIFREVGNSALIGVVVAVGAWLLAGWALEKRRRVMALAVPGLFGGLLVSLVVLAVFQVPGLHLLRDSPVPLLVALVLQAMPLALLMRHFLAQTVDPAALHVARTMSPRGALVREAGLRHLISGAVVFLGAYSDFTANALLAPPALTSAFARIFNLLHYGQNAVLAATVVVTTLVPVVLLALTVLAVGIYSRARE